MQNEGHGWAIVAAVLGAIGVFLVVVQVHLHGTDALLQLGVSLLVAMLISTLVTLASGRTRAKGAVRRMEAWSDRHPILSPILGIVLITQAGLSLGPVGPAFLGIYVGLPLGYLVAMRTPWSGPIE